MSTPSMNPDNVTIIHMGKEFDKPHYRNEVVVYEDDFGNDVRTVTKVEFYTTVRGGLAKRDAFLSVAKLTGWDEKERRWSQYRDHHSSIRIPGKTAQDYFDEVVALRDKDFPERWPVGANFSTYYRKPTI